jgi:hypothetical protein
MKRLFFAIGFLFCFLFTRAQSVDELAVQQVIDVLFNGMAAKDVVAIKSVMNSSARLQSISIDDSGKPNLQLENVDDFVKHIAAIPANMKIEERVLYYDVKVDGNLAQIWAEYQFYINNKMSHCGVDSFQLYKDESGDWKIIQIADTRHKDKCD